MPWPATRQETLAASGWLAFFGELDLDVDAVAESGEPGEGAGVGLCRGEVAHTAVSNVERNS